MTARWMRVRIFHRKPFNHRGSVELAIFRGRKTGALVAIGYPKLGGRTGGYARYIAICPLWTRVRSAPVRRSVCPCRSICTTLNLDLR